MKYLLLSTLIGALLSACSQNDGFNFSGIDPALTVPPTQLMVLGTPHLINYKDVVSHEDLEPLLERLMTYAPDIITIENSSGMTCQRVRAYPREHVGYAESYCFDGATYREESGLSIAEASFQSRRALLEWPDEPSASQRRALAAAFIASDEVESAVVQWLRLDEKDCVMGDGLGAKSVELLNMRAKNIGESYSIAAHLAARLGHNRLFYADDHGSYLYLEAEREVYGARVSELWAVDQESCQVHFNDPRGDLGATDITAAYRWYNSRPYQKKHIECDWKKTMNDGQGKAYGRQYTLGWQARNLRMTALIMTAATTKPGGRVLSIVGAAHKSYFEAYLDQMHDVEIINTDVILK